MPLDLDYRNTNCLWCSVLVETLVRCGVRHAVISPGSRSTALTIAFVRHAGIEAIPVLDERSAGFFALGLAKRTHVPVALVCTSGTAVANYLPAVIEAAESATPLLLLTADRPPELRACASGQTIDQQKIFGDFVRFFHEVAVPEPRIELLRYLRQTAAHACQRAQRPTAGPVHLNLPFRDPLPPLRDATAEGLSSQIEDSFFSHLEPEPRASGIRIWQRPTTTRGLIVAGPDNPRDRAGYAASVRQFAEQLGWPILADALSPLRHVEEGSTPIVAHYDAILREPRVAEMLKPRTVIALGDWPTSKVLRSWLSSSQAEILMFSGSGMNRDALHGRARHLPFAAEQLAAEGTPPADPAYVNAWRAAESAAAAALSKGIQNLDTRFEGKAVQLLARHLPEEAIVFVASSMPVRDAEYFWPRTAKRFEFHFNRGANGIDGTLSTALGVAHASDQPAVLLTGDLAFLHDGNGLLLAEHFRGSLTIVLIDNNGGGIFEHLPVAQFDPPFERFFATPQRVDFGALCRAHGVRHEHVVDWNAFTSAILQPREAGIQVLETRTDRKADAATRKRLLAEAGRAVAAALA
ncbi:MAG: 2-succinyl-5-enolpyruvyl-6-hydroxy-3-cyclohexene-1-carboxylic-acid synthase [Opitutaceae bacterium]